MNSIQISLDHTVFLTENGLEVYIGDGTEPSLFLELDEMVEEFLDDVCDDSGKVDIIATDEFEAVVQKFKACLKMLEDARP